MSIEIKTFLSKTISENLKCCFLKWNEKVNKEGYQCHNDDDDDDDDDDDYDDDNTERKNEEIIKKEKKT